MKQYVPIKTHNFALKNFILAGLSSLVYDFFTYQGMTTFSEYLQVKGLKSAAILHLSKGIKEGKSLFFYKFFNSMKLLEGLDAL